MKILFIHQNFPGQYRHLTRSLGADPAHRVVFITQRSGPTLPGVKKIEYRPARQPAASTHRYLVGFEQGVLNGQAVARIALDLKQQGFVPDIVCAHPGWGEALYVKDVFPETPLLDFCEWYYHAFGADTYFDPSEPVKLDEVCRIRTRNALQLLNLEACDCGVAPTHWQRQQFPAEFRRKIAVIHDGIDTSVVKPDPHARLQLPDGLELGREHEVVTYVARNLEPYRGFPSFLRALPEICEQRPDCHVLIVGGDEVSYGARPTAGYSYREQLLAEVAIDPRRVHFLGRIPYQQFLKLLQVSSAHVYLTVPFVLSWSLLEAMAAGCSVIGSATPPVIEVIEHGCNGFLVDFFSPGAIAEQVCEVLARRTELASIAAAARQTVVERYDLLSRCLPQHLALIRSLTSRAAVPGPPVF